MKKWMYLLSGVLIGAVVATSGSAVAAQVKSLVGQKVTGEYKVIVNGQELQDKGAVINGRTNAPVRAISESIGADLKVDNKAKVIEITTGPSGAISSQTGKEYDLQTSILIEQKTSDKKTLEAEIKNLEEFKAREEKQYALLEEGFPKQLLKQSLDSINQQLAEKQQELDKVNAELAELEK
ncbi:stalk domain-containing protein [Paenibacillus cisolokensis]|uniref:stalk domain-containing protein n=1 Tax=Paenibacillus cisolokensis TaxID=1658519 RepID=UPI003D2BCB74